MRKLALLLALLGAPVMAAPQPHVDADRPATAINPDLGRNVEPCLQRQRRPKTMIMLMRTDDGRVIILGAIKVRQRC